MRYCCKCGSKTENKFIEGDKLKREICPKCNYINYINPKIIVGVLPKKNNSLLLCKRDIEPGRNKWTFPSGFMEMDESLEDGARREAIEEANLRYKILKLYGTYSIPRIGQVLFVYLGEITNEDFYACDETQEVKLFEVDKIPWEDIAFPSVKFFIKKYVLDYNDDLNFKFHSNYA